MTVDYKRYNLLIEKLPVPYAYLQLAPGKNPTECIVFDANHAFNAMVDLNQDEIIGRDMVSLLPELTGEDLDWLKICHLVSATAEPIQIEHFNSKLNSWYEIGLFCCEPGFLAAFFMDVTTKKQSEKLLRKSEQRFRSLVGNMKGGIVVEDENRKIMLTNQTFCDIFSIPASPEALIGSDCSQSADQVKHLLTEPDLFPRRIAEIIEKQEVVIGEEVYFANGFVYERDYIPVFDEYNNFIGHMWQYRDITERKQYEEKLIYLSLHDQLTGLYNRTFFVEEMHRLSKSRDFPITIISADIDGLKQINDLKGHAKGDEHLKGCAEVLSKSLRSSDILARIGGDEFVILLPRTDREAGESILVRIHNQVAKYNKKTPEMPLSLSLGLATADSNEIDLEEIYKQADRLMLKDKLTARGKLNW